MKNKLMLFLPLAAYAVFVADCAAEEGPSSGSEGSIYSYAEDDIPAVFFFPKEKARWDGYKVTMKEWYTLTDLQKEKFVSEYTGELKRQYNSAIDVFMGMDYIQALNLFSYHSNDRAINEPSTRFIDKMLSGQGKTASRSPN